MTGRSPARARASSCAGPAGRDQSPRLSWKGIDMIVLLGAFTQGLILSLLGLGIFISFRIFAFSDITADGSLTLGASVAAVLLMHEVNPFLATAAGFGAGML